MTREEFSILVKGMKAVYSDPKFIADKDAFDVWFSMLNDLDYKETSNALRVYMMTNKFPPTIADIRSSVIKTTQPREMSPSEAWALVYKAICNSSYGAKEEFEKLPPLIQKTVGSPDNLRSLAGDSNFNIEVEKSLFERNYNVQCKRAEEITQLPGELKNLLGGVTSETTNYIGTSG